MADRDGLKDLIKTVQALTEKIDSSSRQLGIEDEVSKVFKRNDSNKTTGNSSSENSRPLSSSTLASTSTTTGFSGFSSTSRFRRLMNMRKIGNNITKKCDKRKSGPFMCDVILLAGPNMTSVPKQGTKLALIEQGHILSAVQFDKNMTEIQVQSTIIEAFGDKLLVDVDIEILMSAHNKLVKPTLAPGQGIDGVILNRLFRSKPVYVAPSRQLIKMDCDDEDEEDQVQSNSCQAPNQPSNQDCSSSKSSSTARVICEKCSCTFSYGEQCIRCIQNEEYQQSLSADQILSSSKSKDEASANDKATDSPEVVEQQVDEPVDVEQLRGHRLAHLEGVRSSVETVEDNTLDFLPSESSTSLNIAIHRTTIKQDLIREFKDDSVLESEIQFKLINVMRGGRSKLV